MEISYLGKSTFRIKGKKATIFTDPIFDQENTEGDIFTLSRIDDSMPLYSGSGIICFGPGEYEKNDVKIVGVSNIIDKTKNTKNTIFNLNIDNINICHLGEGINKELSSEQMEQIGKVDILLLPIPSDSDYDPAISSKLVSELEPKIVIPMYEQNASTNSTTLEKLLKELGSENAQSENKLVLKGDKLPEELTITLLNKIK